MSDVFSKRKRSEVMSRIRAQGNKATELAMIALFRRNHITGWRRHQAIYGKPDFVFLRSKTAVFVDGCFWHCCPYHFKMPQNNRIFWRNKLNRNKIRDRRVNKILKMEGWKVLRIWQHELKNNEHRLERKIIQYIMNTSVYCRS